MKASRSCEAETVLRMKSKLPAWLHLASGVLRDHHFVGAEALRVLALPAEVVKSDDVRAEGVGELDAHVTETAEADDADLLALVRRPSAAAGE